MAAAGKNAPLENRSAGITGFKGADNLADGPDGKLWIVEDNAYSDIWVYDPRSKDANGDGYRDGMHLFASLKDKPAGCVVASASLRLRAASARRFIVTR